MARIPAIKHHHLEGIIRVEGNIMFGESFCGCVKERSGGT